MHLRLDMALRPIAATPWHDPALVKAAIAAVRPSGLLAGFNTATIDDGPSGDVSTPRGWNALVDAALPHGITADDGDRSLVVIPEREWLTLRAISFGATDPEGRLLDTFTAAAVALHGALADRALFGNYFAVHVWGIERLRAVAAGLTPATVVHFISRAFFESEGRPEVARVFEEATLPADVVRERHGELTVVRWVHTITDVMTLEARLGEQQAWLEQHLG